MAAPTAAVIFFVLGNAVFVATHCTFHDYSPGANHLDCSRKELVNIYGINVHGLLLSLDLSHNEFTRITDNVFQTTRLVSIEKLNFSFNKIRQVGSLAFNGLNELKRLDLSHNQIKTIDLSIWPGLLMLNVSFNGLVDVSKIYCPTLEILDISNNAVVNLILAEELANMKHLNITSNKISTLHSEQFLKLSLFSLQIRGNKIRCDTATTNLLEYLSSRGTDIHPTCPPIQVINTFPSIAPPRTPPEHPILTPNTAVLATNIENDRNFEQLQRDQSNLLNFIIIICFTQIIVIALLIFVSILLITFRLADELKTRRIELHLEEMDEEVPPPPYRNHSAGFVI